MTTTMDARKDLTALAGNFFLNDSLASDFRIGAVTNNPAPGVVWDDVDAERRLALDITTPGKLLPWARIQVRHVTERQATLGNVNGKIRWRRGGILHVQVFVPRGMGLRTLDPLVQGLIAAMRGRRTTNGVVVRNARLSELGPAGASPWFAATVVSEFEYDQIE